MTPPEVEGCEGWFSSEGSMREPESMGVAGLARRVRAAERGRVRGITSERKKGGLGTKECGEKERWERWESDDGPAR